MFFIIKLIKILLLLQLNMVGYPLVLPDMIGGNGYSENGLAPPGSTDDDDNDDSFRDNRPSKEIFLRWLQANTFMPCLQFSYVPWDYDSDVSEAFFRFTAQLFLWHRIKD